MKTLFKVILGLLLLAILAITALLLPAHLQVRSVEPELPSLNQLEALHNIPNGPISIQYVNTSSQVSTQGILSHTAFIVEWADGKRFMIDSGMDAETAMEFGKLLESLLDAEPAVPHGNIAELLGEGIKQIDGLGFTHLHIDHVQGVIPFCSVRGEGVTLYQTHWQRDLQNTNTEEGEDIIAASCLARVAFSDSGLTNIEAFPGLALVGMGGHTPGSTLWAVPVGGRLWLIAGDITNTKADLLHNTGKGFIYSYLLVPEDTERTQEMRLWLSALDEQDNVQVIVPHDIEAIKQSGLPMYPQ